MMQAMTAPAVRFYFEMHLINTIKNYAVGKLRYFHSITWKYAMKLTL
jgi:hypothetical protein